MGVAPKPLGKWWIRVERYLISGWPLAVGQERSRNDLVSVRTLVGAREQTH